jgi:hypothetical protein
MEILSESDRGSNDTTQVEDGPKHGNKSTFLAFSWVSHHKRTLSSPKKTRADAMQGTGCDDKISDTWVDVQGTLRACEPQSSTEDRGLTDKN